MLSDHKLWIDIKNADQEWIRICDKLMSHAGLEPATTWLKVKCSTTWASSPSLLPLDKSKCPEPESNQRHVDFQSTALPTELSGHNYQCSIVMKKNSGDRIWTYDLWVMSPTSFQTAPPRVKGKWAKVDSNHRRQCQQIYSLLPLATREFAQLVLYKR